MRRALLILTLFSVGGCAVARPGPDAAWWLPPAADAVAAPRYAGMQRSSKYLTMRDGVRLAVDLYLPVDLEPGARIPAILFQTRYVRSLDYRWPFGLFMGGRFDDTIAYLVRRGYAWVAVDVRGSGASFGTRPHPYAQAEIEDGAEIVDWILSQPWSSGRVGAWGNSYTGGSALFLLANRHPAVRAVMPRFAMFDVYAEAVFPGGIHLSWLTDTWGRLAAALDKNRLADFFGDRVELAVRGIKPVDGPMGDRLLARAVAGHRANGDIRRLVQGIAHRDDVSPAMSGVSVDTISPHRRLAEIDGAGAAVYLYTGWLDAAFVLSEIHLFLNLNGERSKLTIGPWDHGGWQNTSPFAESRRPGFQKNAEILRFFDRYLKDQPTGVDTEPRVHYFTLGEERWKAASTWPPPGAVEQTWYLGPERVLRREAPAGPGPGDAYRVDFEASSGPHSRWRSLVNLERRPVGYPDRAERDRRLLVYQSPPLDAPLEVTGHPWVDLFIRANAPDAAVFVYLEDVDPQGRVRYVTEGQLRALHRKLADQPPYRTVGPSHSFNKSDAQPLEPGEPAELTFSLYPTSYRFARGHAIRIALAGADAGHFAPLPDPPPAEGLTIEFLRDAAHRSRIVLPVMPALPEADGESEMGLRR